MHSRRAFANSCKTCLLSHRETWENDELDPRSNDTLLLLLSSSKLSRLRCRPGGDPLQVTRLSNFNWLQFSTSFVDKSPRLNAIGIRDFDTCGSCFLVDRSVRTHFLEDFTNCFPVFLKTIELYAKN